MLSKQPGDFILSEDSVYTKVVIFHLNSIKSQLNSFTNGGLFLVKLCQFFQSGFC